MSSPDRDAAPPSAQERAEELMERVASDASRIFLRTFGRVREEVEDIVAEGRSRYEHAPERHEP